MTAPHLTPEAYAEALRSGEVKGAVLLRVREAMADYMLAEASAGRFACAMNVAPYRLGGLTGYTPCGGTVTLVTPIEVSDWGEITRHIDDPVCATCGPNHMTDHMVGLSEAFDWDTDPRVLRYAREEVMERIMFAIRDMGDD